MKMQSQVYFTVDSQLFYLWQREPSLELTSHREEKLIEVKSDSDNKIKRTSQLVKEFCDFCAEFSAHAKNDFFCLDKITYDIWLNRMLLVKDADDKEYFQRYRFNGEIFKFILVTNGKLIYPPDVKDALKVPFYFQRIVPNNPDKSKLNDETPVFIEKYDERRATVRNLTQDDTVLDTNGIQLWPMDENLGKLSPCITELLKRKREKIYQV